MQNKEDIKDKVTQYRLVILGFLIVLLISVSFYAGVIVSCQNGLLKGFQCIQPEKVATVSVCEYNPHTCVANCRNALVNDVAAFCDQYNNVLIP